MKKYKNPIRGVGSQKEKPSFMLFKQGGFSVEGYQSFSSVKGKIKCKNNVKYGPVMAVVRKYEPESVNDIGCSAGLLSFLCKETGVDTVRGYDHDEEYIYTARTINDHAKKDVDFSVYNFGEKIPRAEMTICISVVHWVWNCTADFNSFDKMFDYLSTTTEKYLLIEFVHPEDSAIRKFNHLDFGERKEGYAYDNFLKSAEKFGKILDKFNTKTTRECLLIEK